MAGSLFGAFAQTISSRPFQPHPLLPNADLQTILGVVFPYIKTRSLSVQRILISISKTTTIAAEMSLQPNPTSHPTLIILPGVYGASTGAISVALSHKAYLAGYNVANINLPNQGDTAHLTNRYYAIGQSEVVTGTMNQLEEQGLRDIVVIGISYGGNICAKALGELGEGASSRIKAAVLLSPSIDPNATLHHLELAHHSLYETSITRGLNRLNKARATARPDHVSYNPQKRLRTWMDIHMTTPEPFGWGYKDAEDYMTQNSAVPWMDRIKVPTLIIHAEDDPIVPMAPIQHPSIANNAHIYTVITKKGGHCGFVGKTKPGDDQDRHWDQNRAIDFLKLFAPPRV